MINTTTWAWIGGSLGSNITTAALTGTTVPLGGLTDITWHDVGDNGKIKDTDTPINAPPVGEGVTVGGTFHQVAQFTIWDAALLLKDGTDVAVKLHVYRLDDGTLYYRLPDSEIATLQGMGYSRAKIASITLDTMTSTDAVFEDMVVANNDDAYPCFTAGTMIRTLIGEVPVEDLAPGDLILTQDHGPQELRWIGQRRLYDLHQKRVPIRIRAGALGNGLPEADLLVSPQHRMLVRSKIAMRMFGAPEVLVAAIHLTGIEGISPATDLAGVTYVHLLFDRHEVIFANGAPTELLYAGAEALKSLPAAAHEEIFALFPELAEPPLELPAARLLVKGPRARRLARRHTANIKPVLVN